MYINLGLSVYIRFAEGLSDKFFLTVRAGARVTACLKLRHLSTLRLLLLYIFSFCGEESVNIVVLMDWFLPLFFLSSMHLLISFHYMYVQVLLLILQSTVINIVKQSISCLQTFSHLWECFISLYVKIFSM